MKEKSTVCSPSFSLFPSDRIPNVTIMSMYISLLTIAISVNYTSDPQELSEANTYY